MLHLQARLCRVPCRVLQEAWPSQQWPLPLPLLCLRCLLHSPPSLLRLRCLVPFLVPSLVPFLVPFPVPFLVPFLAHLAVSDGPMPCNGTAEQCMFHVLRREGYPQGGLTA